jgi:leucyl-tRNA synthetase
MPDYHPQELDRKWQQKWAAARAFEVEVDRSKPKFYCLEMFAYPSGHAHMGTCATTASATSWRA